VVGFGLNASRPGKVCDEPQAASPRPQITKAKVRSSFMSIFRCPGDARQTGGIIHAATPAPVSTPITKTVAPITMNAGRMVSNSAPHKPTELAPSFTIPLPTRECSFRNRRFPAFCGHTTAAVLRFRHRVARLQRMAWSLTRDHAARRRRQRMLRPLSPGERRA
jgi:hypothetical protein